MKSSSLVAAHQFPFASSEVEMPIVRSSLWGVSTSLDTNGERGVR